MINQIQFHLPMQPYVDFQARAIMQLAASPIHLPQDDPFNRSSAVWPSFRIQMDKDGLIPIDSTTIPQVAQAGSHG